MKTWLNTRERKMKHADPINVNRAKAFVMYRRWLSCNCMKNRNGVYSQDCALEMPYVVRAIKQLNTLRKSISVFF